MLNRNAEALFWMGRYLERAENHARLIDVYYHFTHDGQEADGSARAARIIDALGARQDYETLHPDMQEDAALFFITLDRTYANSLFSCISQARNNLRTLREKLPSELWDALNGTYLWLLDAAPSNLLADSPHHFYKQVKDRISVFWGVQHSVMMRENEWHLIGSGRYLERAENVVRILRSVTSTSGSNGEDAAYPYWLALLRSVSGYQSFRRHYADNFAAEPIMEFLMTNLAFPRSVHYAISHLEQHVKRLDPGDPAQDALRKKIMRMAEKLRTEIACLEREDFAAGKIDELLAGISQSCMKIGALIAESFFRREEATA